VAKALANPLPGLVMFVGSSPGAGKSTLSHLLYRQCVMHTIPVEWWYEEDVFQFDDLRRFADQMVRADPAAMESFEAGTQLAVQAWSDPSIMRITDSYLPGFFWLRPLYPREDLERYSERLWTALAPLSPLIIDCHADVETAFRRATRQRGNAWGKGIPKHVMSWQMPQYPEAPLRSEQDVLRFWSWLDHESSSLLASWPGDVLTLETTTTSREALAKQMLDYLELDELPAALPLSNEQLQSYTGIYVLVNGHERSDQITIKVTNGGLYANLYWPSGSSLIAEQEDFFRLQSTSRTVKFHRNGAGTVDGFAYTTTLNGEERYVRLNLATADDGTGEHPDGL
jgi:hypothetical protein